MMDETKCRLYSRSSIGRNRWFWVVVEDWLSDPITKGIARSPEEALAVAECQGGPVVQRNATLAKSHWAKQRAMERQRSVGNGDDALPLQFAYRCYWYYSEYDGSQREVIELHRIVKKTKKRIYVEDDDYDRRPLSGEWWDYDRSTFVLDRREFETIGKADRSSKGWWDNCTYYADPALYHAERGRSARPPCFEEMDLPVDATVAQIKSAFRRLSRSTHPDAGGTDGDFVRLRQSYEAALKIAAGRG
jgi:hypothetical protein